jgi:hypothetical protein
MLSEAHVIERSAQPYVAIKSQVTMQTLGAVLPGLHPHVFAWLGQRGISPAGAPFWKYNVIDMNRSLEVEVGVPVAAAVPATTRCWRACSRPAGTRRSATRATLTACSTRPRPC